QQGNYPRLLRSATVWQRLERHRLDDLPFDRWRKDVVGPPEGGGNFGLKTKNPLIVGKEALNTNDLTYNNPVLIAERDGPIHFLFCFEYMRCFYQRSDDDGRTWSKPREITGDFEGFRKYYDWKVLATGPGHGIQLKNGRLVVPVWISL